MFFNSHIVIRSAAELSTPIGAFMGLRSHANLPCLVNLAQKRQICKYRERKKLSKRLIVDVFLQTAAVVMMILSRSRRTVKLCVSL